MQNLRVAAVQFEHAAGDKLANFAKIEAFTARAAGEGVQIVVFPECCISGYWFMRNLTRDQLAQLAEPVPGPSSARLLALARQHRLSIGAGLVERDDDGRMYNTYLFASPDGALHKHRKIQAFEHDAITPGDRYTVFDTVHGCRVGILICYDNNIIENVRMTALLGAEVLIAPHQTGGCNSVSPHGMKCIDPALWHARQTNPKAIQRELLGPNGKAWIMRWLPARAHDNGLFLIFANGVGVDDDEIRTGNSMILDPYGRTLASTDEPADALITADLDAALLENCTGRRWLRARRPELYGPLAQATGQEAPTRSVRFGAGPRA